MVFVIDLDGTLLDYRYRAFSSFKLLVGDQKLTFSEYFSEKRKGRSNAALLRERYGYGERQVDDFESELLRVIESDEMLDLDHCIPGTHSALLKLGRAGKLYLCTNRQRRAGVERQLERFSLGGFFDRILVTEQTTTKRALIRGEVVGLTARSWLVGDTRDDIDCANQLRILSCGVTSGFQTSYAIAQSNPTMIKTSLPLCARAIAV